MTGHELVERAEAAAANAYAPYSKYHVGASLLTVDGRVFDGVNVFVGVIVMVAVRCESVCSWPSRCSRA